MAMIAFVVPNYDIGNPCGLERARRVLALAGPGVVARPIFEAIAAAAHVAVHAAVGTCPRSLARPERAVFPAGKRG
jgi:hypothetical protein